MISGEVFQLADAAEKLWEEQVKTDHTNVPVVCTFLESRVEGRCHHVPFDIYETHLSKLYSV